MEKKDTDNFFIHFSDNKTLLEFIEYNKKIIEIGHICCEGKGCVLISYNNQPITNYKTIYEIRNTYLYSN